MWSHHIPQPPGHVSQGLTSSPPHSPTPTLWAGEVAEKVLLQLFPLPCVALLQFTRPTLFLEPQGFYLEVQGTIPFSSIISPGFFGFQKKMLQSEILTYFFPGSEVIFTDKLYLLGHSQNMIKDCAFLCLYTNLHIIHLKFGEKLFSISSYLPTTCFNFLHSSSNILYTILLPSLLLFFSSFLSYSFSRSPHQTINFFFF